MRKTVRRATLVLALTPFVSIPMTAAFAGGAGAGSGSTVVVTPAPAGDASAVGAEVSGVLAIGKTKAHAGSDGGSSSADGLDLLGQRISGGDQSGVGSNGGNLIGTGDTPLGDAEVAPWSNKVTNDNGGYQSMAEAALAHASLAGVAAIWLLHSKSGATWTPDKSSGDAQSDGAEVSALGMLDIKVLHSEAHSDGTSHSDLLVVNGTEIGSSTDANGMCAIDASPVIDLVCLTANGGTGSTGVTSSDSTVLTGDVGSGALTGTVSGTTSQGGSGGTGAPKPKPLPQPSQRSHHHTFHSRLPHTPGPQSLPFTGGDTGRLAALAAAFATLGAAMTAFGRRRRRLPFAV